MWLMPIAALVEAVIAVNVMLSIGFIPPLVVFLAVLVTMAVLGFARPGRRVYLIGGIVLLLFVALNLPFAVEGLIDPIGSSHAWTDIIAIVVGIIGGIAGIAAFVGPRRRRPGVRALGAPLGEVLAILVAGLLVGTSYVSVRGYSELEGTPGLGVANGVVDGTRPGSRRARCDRDDVQPEEPRTAGRAGHRLRGQRGQRPAHVRHRAERPGPLLPCARPIHDGRRAGPRRGGLIHLLVCHSRPSAEHGRDAGGDRVMAPRPDITAGLRLGSRAAYASGVVAAIGLVMFVAMFVSFAVGALSPGLVFGRFNDVLVMITYLLAIPTVIAVGAVLRPTAPVASRVATVIGLSSILAVVILQAMLVVGALTFAEQVGPVSFALLAFAAWLVIVGHLGSASGALPHGVRMGLLAATYIGYPFWAFWSGRHLLRLAGEPVPVPVVVPEPSLATTDA